MSISGDNDVIEISDDSSDGYEDEPSAGSSNHIKRKKVISISDEEEYYYESSDSEPEIECDIWDDDCVVSKLLPQTKAIQGFHLKPTCAENPEPEEKHIKRSIELRDIFTSDEYFMTLKDNFLNDNAFEDKNCEILRDPWKVLVLNNVLSDPYILDEVRKTFYELPWNYRRMDLYEFFQTPDLKTMHAEHIKMIYDFLKTDLKDWVGKLVGLELTEVSATCSFYGDTDFLLVHDDQNDDRAVAFVLYLTGKEGWSVDWGGALQLFDRDEDDQPDKCTRNIFPKNNQLVLFPVSDHSYHQVEEVTCRNFCRLSINGWFHTKQPLTFNTPLYEKPLKGIHSDKFSLPEDFDVKIEDWTDYDFKHNYRILYTLEEESEISLKHFFHESMLKELTDAIKSPELKWDIMKPPNRQHYSYLSEEQEFPEILTSFINLFKSFKFVEVITRMSNLQVKRVKWDLQKWTPGCYSLINDQKHFELDLIVFFSASEEKIKTVGGHIHYITLEDEEQNALLSITPKLKRLNIVYSDTPKYISYVSNQSQSKEFYVFIASYIE